MPPRIDVIELVVADMARSLAFYRRLGIDLPPEADGQPHVEAVLAGGMRLLFDLDTTIASFDPTRDLTTPGRQCLGFALESAAEVDQTYTELVAAGYEGHLKPWDAFWGQRYAIVHDPDGIPVDLFATLPAQG